MVQRSVAVREKTLAKTKEAQQRFAAWEKRQIEKEQKRLDEPKPEEQTGVTQAEQMQSAVFTEQANLQSLHLLQQIEMTRQKHTYAKKDNPTALFVRSAQRLSNGAPTTVFKVPTSENLLPLANFDTSKRMRSCRPNVGLINKKSLACAISGKKAKYLDPMTKMPYATKDAFKILREKFYQSEEEKTGQRIQALNELLSLKKDKHKRHRALKPEAALDLPDQSNRISIAHKLLGLPPSQLVTHPGPLSPIQDPPPLPLAVPISPKPESLHN